MEKLVIVGGGHAGFNLVDALVRTGYPGTVTLIHEEDCLPYDRPSLSKEYLSDDDAGEVPLLRPHSFYVENNIGLVHDRVLRIDRRRQRLVTESGKVVEYGKLVLALGATPINPFEEAGAVALRDVADARRLKVLLEKADTIGIIGAGYIGLELASVAAQSGKQVTIYEKASRVLARSASETLADFLATEHAGHGVEIITGIEEVSVEPSSETAQFRVQISESAIRDFDLVISGIGARPRTSLAEEAGIDTDNGIVVDANLRTSDPHIYAIGDCASYPVSGGYQRPENIQTATDQARYLARLFTTQTTDSYAATPWFWSIQYGHKIQISGLSSADMSEELVTNHGRSNSFSILRSAGERLEVVESVNDPKTHVRARSGKLALQALANS